MANLKKILIVIGTRPEAIKLAPVITKLQFDQRLIIDVCLTGQHKELASDALALFGISENFNLELMDQISSLHHFLSEAIMGLLAVQKKVEPDLIICHGDTASTLAAALSGYYSKIPVAHIEAGLRTSDIYSPWPEEGNRKLVSAIASLNFAPTFKSQQNLLDEGVNKSSIHVTGNTVIDAVRIMSEKQVKGNLSFGVKDTENFILVSCHRRENFGDGLIEICKSIARLASSDPNLKFVFPVHPNPNIKQNVHKYLSAYPNVILTEPMPYNEFIRAMTDCRFILTDSGGIQEEAPYLKKPVLLMRERTERPEAIEAGTVMLVGSKEKFIVQSIRRLLDDKILEQSMIKASNPFGDGFSSEKITPVLYEYLKA